MDDELNGVSEDTVLVALAGCRRVSEGQCKVMRRGSS